MSDKPVSPPPPVVPVADVDAARSSLSSVTAKLEAMMQRAASFSPDELDHGVNDEWSTVQSLRHITFVIDLWLGRIIRGQHDPFHAIGLPPHFMPPKFPPDSSVDPDAAPSFDEACDVMRVRLETLAGYVDELTADELVRPIEGHAQTAGGGLSVIFVELNAHDHFITRDLDIIESARG